MLLPALVDLFTALVVDGKLNLFKNHRIFKKKFRNSKERTLAEERERELSLQLSEQISYPECFISWSIAQMVGEIEV